MLLLLAACGPDDGDAGEAAHLARGILEEQGDPPNAIVRMRAVPGYPYEAAWGRSTLEGVALSAWLAPCVVAPNVQIDATLLVLAGGYPWKILDTGGVPLDPCLTDRLRRLPVEEPVAQGAADVWVVRYRSGEAGPGGHVSGRVAGHTPPPAPALPAPSPPYVLVRKRGSIDWDHIRFAHGNVTWPQMEGSRVATWNPEAIARAVTCPDAAPSLVRVVAEVERGDVLDVETAPENDCVAEKVRGAALAAIALEAASPKAISSDAISSEGGLTVGDARSALVVFDVPVGAW